ncbi:MAG: hypothetical protein NC410_02750 [Oscillibacter sp.]|nr:hypothetical protein [Oscillibacter sp.]
MKHNKKLPPIEKVFNAPKYSILEIGTYLKHRLNAAEKLALTYELHSLTGKELSDIYFYCENEEVYNKKVERIQRKAQKILKNELSWGFSQKPDFIAQLGIELH